MKNMPALHQLKKLILSTKGRFFTVKFIRRTDGALRVMNAKVYSSSEADNTNQHNLVVVYDTKHKETRSIPLENILSFKCGDKEFGGN